MRTETITDPAELRGGDLVDLRSTVSKASITAPLSHDPDVDGDVVTLALRIPGLNGEHSTSVVVRRDAASGWSVSATREAPVPEPIAPGTAGVATVRGVEGVRVMRTDGGTVPKVEEEWFSPTGVPAGGQTIGDVWFHPDDQVTDFVPDVPDCGGSCESAIALRRDVERLRGEWKREVEQRGRKALEDQFDEIVSERTATEVERIREAHKRDIQNLGQANVRLRERLERLSGDSVREAIRTAVRDWNATVRQHTTDWPIQAHVPRDLADDVVVRVLRIVMEDA